MNKKATQNFSSRFYENYWREPKDASPPKDPTTPMRLHLLLATLNNLDSVKKVLDVGCGTGSFSNALQKAGYQTTGMDISENALAEARKVYPHIDFVSNPLDTRWPFKDGTFDAIFSSEVIEHVLGTHEMFKETNRVLKTGGYVILTTPYHGLTKNLIIVLFNFDRHFNNLEGGHIRFFTNKFLKRLLVQYGFETKSIRYIGRIRVIAKSVFMVARKIKDVRE
jgi:2-polyprenyl-6-hydroxyphenyl methylase/3-demethylubiquinone-9 3-methyltransferase